MKHKNSNYVFSQVPSVVRPRSVFDRSRTYKTTLDVGKLIPFYWDEILPGDTIANLNVTAFARLATPIVPFMDNLYMDFFFFFVPYRLVWSNWQRFCGEQDSPDDSTDYLIPQRSFSGTEVTVGSIFDYFGLPLGLAESVSALPFRAYGLIYNEFFRDENLCDPVVVSLDDGPDDGTNEPLSLQYRGKRKVDPFTSALPWPQKGPGVELPIGGYAPVGMVDSKDVFHPLGFGGSAQTSLHVSSSNPGLVSGPVGTAAQVALLPKSASQTYTIINKEFAASSYATPAFADLSATTSVTINALREAFQIQKWYEQLARGGSRYVELVLSMFGCHTGDARLQRPEYLGGGSTPIQIHCVAQTSSTDATTPQGNLAAYGVAGASGIGFTKSFVEHGIVIGLVSVRGDYTYQNNIDRFWSRRTKFDFYWPAFAHLGEVGIKNKEIYYNASDGIYDPDGIFGYQERWYEYRYGMSKITGKLRSNASGTLDCWHLAQNFESCPQLNEEFIQEKPPVERVLAVQDEPQFIFDSVIKCKMARVMPVYSTPGLVDHF